VLKFPNNLYAGLAGYKVNDAYFKAAEGSREVPKVDFGNKAAAPAQTPATAPAH
jgi:hypothetical protein